MPLLRQTIDRGWQFASLALLVSAMQMGLGESANASCGDWLAHNASMSDPSPGNDLRPSPAADPTGTPSPCSGGQCRQAPDVPPPSAPNRSVNLEWDHWGTLADFRLTLKVRKDRFGLEESLIAPDGLLLRLDRPPQT